MAKKLGATKLTDNVLVTSASLTSEVTGVLPVANGGTGTGTYTNGQLLIGNTTGNTLTKATLTAGSNISITNGAGSITIAATAASADAGTLTGTTLASNVVNSSLTSVGTLSSLAVSGNASVGTTASLARFTIQGLNGGVAFATTNTDFNNPTSTGSGFVLFPNASSGNTYHKMYAFQSGNTAYANLCIPGGNVGIGNESPGATFDVTGTAKVSSDVFIGDATGWASSRLQVGNSAASEPTAEFNGTSQTAGQSPVYVWNNAESGATYFISFYSDGVNNARTLRGYINYRRDTATLSLVTSSDYRIKTTYGPYDASGEIFDALKVYDGKMNGSDLDHIPLLLAHEVQEVVPYAVEGEKDAVEEDGTPKLQMMNYSAFIPLLLAEVKSLRARVAHLEQMSNG